MHILITSGGTSEAIDSVRSITNHSHREPRGNPCRNGLAKGHQVTLITTPTALKPDPHPQLRLPIDPECRRTSRTNENGVPQHQVLIHAMAVSDYTPVYMTALMKLRKLRKTFIALSIAKIRKLNLFQRKNTKYSF